MATLIIDSVRADTFKVLIQHPLHFCPVRYGLLRLAQLWPEVYAWSPHNWDSISPRSQVSWRIPYVQCAKSKDLHDSARLLKAVIPSIAISFDNPYLTFVASQHSEAVDTLRQLADLPLWKHSSSSWPSA